MGCLLNFNALEYKPYILCSVKGCLESVEAKGLCCKHNGQIKRHGKILERTIYDRNEIVIKGEIALIHVYNKNCEVICKAIIDTEDVSKVEHLKWTKGNAMGYIFNSVKGPLHRVIMNTDCLIDHIDNDVLNNRKSNLRFCTKRENNFNKRKPNNNTTGYKGVTFDKTRGRLYAYINKDKVRYFLGYYDNPVLAAKAYNEKALELFGEFANLNKI